MSQIQSLDSFKSVKVIAEAFGDENHRGSLVQFHGPIAKEADFLRKNCQYLIVFFTAFILRSMYWRQKL